MGGRWRRKKERSVQAQSIHTRYGTDKCRVRRARCIDPPRENKGRFLASALRSGRESPARYATKTTKEGFPIKELALCVRDAAENRHRFEGQVPLSRIYSPVDKRAYMFRIRMVRLGAQDKEAARIERACALASHTKGQRTTPNLFSLFSSLFLRFEWFG